MSNLQHEVHAAAMEQTAAFYDQIVKDSTQYTPLLTCNSIDPHWIAEGCVTGGIWGPQTDYTRYACAVRDAYGFKRPSLPRKYPAIESADGGPAAFQFDFYETRSLVFKTESIPESPLSQPGLMCSDQRKLFDLESEPDDDSTEAQNVSLEAKRHKAPKEKKPKKSKPVESPKYRAVTDADMNAQYAQYLAGVLSAGDVLETLVDFAKGKLSFGYSEGKLSLLQRDELLSRFMGTMNTAIQNRTFTGAGAKPFSNYVSACWANSCKDAHRRQKRFDLVFQHDTFRAQDDVHADSEESKVTTDQSYTHTEYLRATPDEDRERARLIEEMKSRMSKADLAIFEHLRDSDSDTTTAQELGLSRHQIARARERITKAGRKTVALDTFGVVRSA